MRMEEGSSPLFFVCFLLGGGHVTAGEIMHEIHNAMGLERGPGLLRGCVLGREG